VPTPDWSFLAEREGLMAEPQVLVAERYRLLHRVGSGGMGVVWEGWDERLETRRRAQAALSAI